MGKNEYVHLQINDMSFPLKHKQAQKHFEMGKEAEYTNKYSF